MIANDAAPRKLGSAANRARAATAGRQQARLARQALAQLQSDTTTTGAHRTRWIHALEHRISNPDSALAELGATMATPMTKHGYAALFRRALRGGGVGRANATGAQSGSCG
ncbi:MAG: hypothetical protein K0U84_20440 [Actinomycetia bacterium]|nr:hypothetical protein [Actinomycetes bacterium]